MPFRPNVNDVLSIDNVVYRFTEHPTAKGMPYGQEGRAGVVYQLGDGHKSKKAFKVFRDRFRQPSLVKLADDLAPFASFPGLQVCRRTILTPRQHGELLKQNPELTYAVLMPWIEGPTWMELVYGKESLTPDQSLIMGLSFIGALVGLEQQGAAHCDLSGPNIIVPAMIAGGRVVAPSAVELVDVEQMYGSHMSRPTIFTSGSSGYAHRIASKGDWQSEADRFAGAVIVAEMLGWCDEEVREAAWGESYFQPDEMQKSCKRYTLLLKALTGRWGDKVAKLLTQAWESDNLADCATFGEWLVTLPRSDVPADEAFASLPVKAYSWIRLPEGEEEKSAGAKTPAAIREEQIGPTILPKQRLPNTHTGKTSGSDSLADLFDDALEASRYGEWARAKELLSEVVRQDPHYSRNRHRAQTMLEEAQRHLKSPIPTWVGVLGGALGALVLLGGLGLVFVGILLHKPTPTPQDSSSQPVVTYVTDLAPTAGAVATEPPPQASAATEGPSAIPVSSQATGKIVYTCQVFKDNNRNQICMVNADGSGQRRLTNNDNTNSWYASFAPGGASIVFSSNQSGNHEIYEMDLNGNQTQLTNLGELYAPEISPNGQDIVFTNANGTYSSIWIMKRDGGNPHSVYRSGQNDAVDPSWSPDGGKILFALGQGDNKNLYTINPDGTGLTVLNTTFNTRGRSAWSPNGLYIAGYTGGPWNRSLSIMNSDGSSLRSLYPQGNAQAPSFSPDSGWVAFTGYIDNPGNDDGCEIYILRLADNQIKRLTDNNYCDWQPRWGP